MKTCEQITDKLLENGVKANEVELIFSASKPKKFWNLKFKVVNGRKKEIKRIVKELKIL